MCYVIAVIYILLLLWSLGDGQFKMFQNVTISGLIFFYISHVLTHTHIFNVLYFLTWIFLAVEQDVKPQLWPLTWIFKFLRMCFCKYESLYVIYDTENAVWTKHIASWFKCAHVICSSTRFSSTESKFQLQSNVIYMELSFRNDINNMEFLAFLVRKLKKQHNALNLHM